jgi:hypothetical protein
MRHTKVTSAWRPVRASRGRHQPQGILSALVFNVCLVMLAVASALSVLIISRDHLYAYEYSESGARVIASRIERLNAELIQLDFDRTRQWDDLIAMELQAGDIAAARGFLLSGREMLPGSQANALRRAGDDGARELAALEMLTPGTRARYEERVPLLSRRSETAETTAARDTPNLVGDADDFELLARALIAEPSTDAQQLVLTGLSLGLGGEVSPETTAGALALLVASRRADFPSSLAAEFERLLRETLPVEAFRTAALANASADTAGEFDNAAAAFRSVVNAEPAAEILDALAQIGEISTATTPAAAVYFISHATTLQDLPRLRLVAQAGGDRAAAAAKRLARDGRLQAVARGDLRFNRELTFAVAIAGLALFGILATLGLRLYQTARRIWRKMQDDDYGSELVEIGASNWRPL